MSGLDAGLGRERTRLAWQRTTLTGIAALLVVIRLLVEVFPLVGVLVGVAAVLVLLAPAWSAIRWQLGSRGAATIHRDDGRASLLLALVMFVACAAAIGYVVLG